METIKTKICTKCKINKPFACFNKDNRRKNGLRSDCKDCAKLSKTIWDNNNRDKISLQAKEWKLLNPEKQKCHVIKYKNSDRGIANRKNMKQKRRSLKKQGDVTTNDILNLQQTAKICYWCKCSLKGIKTHIDHYAPLAKGGLHTPSNLVVSCSKCNLSKGAKDPIKFANSIGKLL